METCDENSNNAATLGDSLFSLIETSYGSCHALSFHCTLYNCHSIIYQLCCTSDLFIPCSCHLLAFMKAWIPKEDTISLNTVFNTGCTFSYASQYTRLLLLPWPSNLSFEGDFICFYIMLSRSLWLLATALLQDDSPSYFKKYLAHYLSLHPNPVLILGDFKRHVPFKTPDCPFSDH